ncbi:hypothetical protein ACFY4C_24820 [Actinomadura viridis]|uniref:hypothetical protein n=1 Tax=Actinomadura viridis TaxID=58110 RepID=UPI0036CC5E1A
MARTGKSALSPTSDHARTMTGAIADLMSSAEAGHWARQAGARRLMLTRFWPGDDRAASLAAASAHFDKEVLAAEEDLAVTLGEPWPPPPCAVARTGTRSRGARVDPPVGGDITFASFFLGRGRGLDDHERGGGACVALS